MNIERNDTTLLISDIRDLTAASSGHVKGKLLAEFGEGELTNIDFDCSALGFVDSSGLGAMISFQKFARERGGKLRLLSPQPGVLQVLELTRLHRVFEIVS